MKKSYLFLMIAVFALVSCSATPTSTSSKSPYGSCYSFVDMLEGLSDQELADLITYSRTENKIKTWELDNRRILKILSDNNKPKISVIEDDFTNEIDIRTNSYRRIIETNYDCDQQYIQPIKSFAADSSIMIQAKLTDNKLDFIRIYSWYKYINANSSKANESGHHYGLYRAIIKDYKIFDRVNKVDLDSEYSSLGYFEYTGNVDFKLNINELEEISNMEGDLTIRYDSTGLHFGSNSYTQTLPADYAKELLDTLNNYL
jgi:hypothetical protein